MKGQLKEQKKKREVEAPVCLGDLFAETDEEKEDECSRPDFVCIGTMPSKLSNLNHDASNL